MPNKPRPECPKCGTKMVPLYRKRPRAQSYVRADNAFQCPEDQTLAKGRGRRTRFV